MPEEITQPEGQEYSVIEKINMLADEIDSDAVSPEAKDTPPATSGQAEEREETGVKAEPGADKGGAGEKKGPSTRKIKHDGQEYEVNEDELVRLAQQGYDYTAKTQRLAEKERSLAPLEGLAKTIESDPAFAAYLREYFVRGKAQEQEKEPELDDPIEKLRHGLKKEITETFRKELTEKERQLSHQLTLVKIKQEVEKDPDYQDVTKMMVDHIRSLPEPTGKMVFLQWDQDPDAYIKAFSHYKTVVSALKKAKPAESAEQKNNIPPEAVTRREEKAPILESTGGPPPPDKAAERRKHLSKLKAKALRSGDPNALADWLAESGAVDDLM